MIVVATDGAVSKSHAVSDSRATNKDRRITKVGLQYLDCIRLTSDRLAGLRTLSLKRPPRPPVYYIGSALEILEVQGDIERWSGVGNPADGNHVYAGLGDLADGPNRNSA